MKNGWIFFNLNFFPENLIKLLMLKITLKSEEHYCKKKESELSTLSFLCFVVIVMRGRTVVESLKITISPRVLHGITYDYFFVEFIFLSWRLSWIPVFTQNKVYLCLLSNLFRQWLTSDFTNLFIYRQFENGFNYIFNDLCLNHFKIFVNLTTRVVDNPICAESSLRGFLVERVKHSNLENW